MELRIKLEVRNDGLDYPPLTEAECRICIDEKDFSSTGASIFQDITRHLYQVIGD